MAKAVVLVLILALAALVGVRATRLRALGASLRGRPVPPDPAPPSTGPPVAETGAPPRIPPALDPDHPMATCRRGISRYYLKDYPGARQDLERALALDPEIPNIATFVAMARRKA